MLMIYSGNSVWHQEFQYGSHRDDSYSFSIVHEKIVAVNNNVLNRIACEQSFFLYLVNISIILILV